MRLGFAVKVLGRLDLKSHDTRRWQSGPHLGVSLGYLERILEYLHEERISMYRISSQIAPYVTHPDLPAFHAQLSECDPELERIGAIARRYDIRLSMHPSQYIVLNAPDPQVRASAVRELEYHAEFLDRLGAGPEAVIVIHGGGVYGDAAAATDRWVANYEQLSDRVRARLVLENDERSFPLGAVLRIHERTGVPVVLDTLHHAVLDPDAIPLGEALARAVATWRSGVVAKIHVSSARAEARTISRRDRSTGERRAVEAAPLPAQHADWIDPDDFTRILAAGEGLRFDAMLEAKQKDLALLRLRSELSGRGVTLA